MQTTTIGTLRNRTRRLWVIGAMLALVLTGATIVTVVVSRSDEPERASILGPAAADSTTLALDRDGADLIAPVVSAAPDTTTLSLDRDGADAFQRPLHHPTDTTTVDVDRGGSNDTYTFNRPGFTNPSTEGTGTDEWTDAPGRPGFTNPPAEGTETVERTDAPEHPGFINPYLQLVAMQ